MKPLKWVETDDGKNVRIVECLLILKWGGVLTEAGCRTAERIGRHFRTGMYPAKKGGSGYGVLRLHATFRHDLKLYSSDEGRVSMTAVRQCQSIIDLKGRACTHTLSSTDARHDDVHPVHTVLLPPLLLVLHKPISMYPPRRPSLKGSWTSTVNSPRSSPASSGTTRPCR